MSLWIPTADEKRFFSLTKLNLAELFFKYIGTEQEDELLDWIHEVLGKRVVEVFKVGQVTVTSARFLTEDGEVGKTEGQETQQPG